MLLAATEKGIGSLWICDIFFAYAELCEWLGGDGQLVAAIAFGYPNESPGERPRKRMEDVAKWKGKMDTHGKEAIRHELTRIVGAVSDSPDRA